MQRLHVMVDVETNGPAPGLYSMIEIGCVVVEDQSKTFFAQLKPLPSTLVLSEALQAIGRTAQETFEYPPAGFAIRDLDAWLQSLEAKPIFFSDNNGFDFSFVNWYCWRFLDRNPFGHSSRSLPEFYAGGKHDLGKRQAWKKWRRTPHTHNALDDARGNVEALRTMLERGWRL